MRCTSAKFLEIGPRVSQQLDDAMTDAAAAMHGEARRLVDHQQPFVFVNHPIEHVRGEFRRRRRRTRADARRRNPNLIAFLEFVLGPDPATVHPNLATPQQTVDSPFGNTGQFGAQEIVDSLAGPVGCRPGPCVRR